MISAGATSATFAREAARHLRDGEIQSAIEVCVAGTRAYPDYAMGHLVLGRCYELFGRTQEALAAYRTALSKLPDNPTLISLVKRAEEKERKEFELFVAEQEKRFERKAETAPSEETVEQPPSQEESAIEYLAKRLQDVRRIKPDSASPTNSPAAENPGATILTATVAEILAKQGAYAEAIKAYRELALLHPGDKKYTVRVTELERLLDEQERSKKKAP